MFANISEQENRVVLFTPLSSQVFVENAGYNHFRYIKGISYARKQSTYTVHFVLGGKGALEMGGKSYALKAGDIFFCPPDEPFAYYPDASDPWEYVWISASGSGVFEHIDACGFSVKTPIRTEWVTDNILNLLRELVGYGIGDGIKAAYKGTAIFYALVSELCLENAVAAKSERGLGRTHAQKAAECIRQNFANPSFKIDDIGRMIFVSHSYLCRVYEKNFGVTLKKYLIQCRMEKAKELLLKSDLTVKDIALSCGYEDIPHFCKTFQKLFGLTPTEFRLNKITAPSETRSYSHS